jgi:hypothetical protein
MTGESKTQGKAVGVGLHLARGPHGEVVVKDVKVGGAAATAGVQPGSVIHSVNGQLVTGMDTRQVRDQILGESGSTITFHLQPPNSQHVEVLSLVRDGALVSAVGVGLVSPARKDTTSTAQHRPQGDEQSQLSAVAAACAAFERAAGSSPCVLVLVAGPAFMCLTSSHSRGLRCLHLQKDHVLADWQRTTRSENGLHMPTQMRKLQ